MILSSHERKLVRLDYQAAREAVIESGRIRFQTVQVVLLMNAALFPAYFFALANVARFGVLPAVFGTTLGIIANLGAFLIEQRTTKGHRTAHGRAQEMEAVLFSQPEIGWMTGGVGGVYRAMGRARPWRSHAWVFMTIYGFLLLVWITMAVAVWWPALLRVGVAGQEASDGVLVLVKVGSVGPFGTGGAIVEGELAKGGLESLRENLKRDAEKGGIACLVVVGRHDRVGGVSAQNKFLAIARAKTVEQALPEAVFRGIGSGQILDVGAGPEAVGSPVDAEQLANDRRVDVYACLRR